MHRSSAAGELAVRGRSNLAGSPAVTVCKFPPVIPTPRRETCPRKRLAAVDGAATSQEAAHERANDEEHPVSAIRASCYGCGATLQTAEIGGAGYVTPEVLKLKRQYRQASQVLCGRCQELSHGGMVPGVADLWRDPRSSRGKSNLATPEQLRQQLAVVRNTHAVVVLMIDLLDASGSFLSRTRDLVGKNPVVIVGTKADLLPRGTDLEAVSAWLQDTALHKRLNAISVCLVSSHTRDGVAKAASAILKDRRGRDVYILGAANVGKSAFIRALMQEMSAVTSLNFDPMAASRARRLPVESAMPGTTLRLIPLQAFSSSSSLYDTPGVHLHHRLIHMLSPAELKAIHPWKKLRPYIPPAPREIAAASAHRQPSGTYFWGGLLRIDVTNAPAATQLVFYGPSALHVTAEPLMHGTRSIPASLPSSQHSAAAAAASERLPAAVGNSQPSSEHAHAQPVFPTADREMSEVNESNATVRKGADGQRASTPAMQQNQQTSEQQPLNTSQQSAAQDQNVTADARVGGYASADARQLFGAASVAARGGLVIAKQVTINAAGQVGPLTDIAVSGLSGWVAIFAPGQRGPVDLKIWAPRGTEVYIRPPMPVGLVPS